METTENKSTVIAVAQKLVDAVWPYVTGRRGLIMAALVVAGAGLWLNWGWLVAMGAAPFLVAILPCAVMCALGVCMNHKK